MSESENNVSAEPSRRIHLTRPSEIRAWIAEHGFQPSKVLGQNFLIDGNILRILVEAAEITPDDRVLEIGPGLGVLTEALTGRAAQVLAVEKDKRLAAHLRESLGTLPNLQIIEADALDVDLADLKRKHGLNKFLSNLPYSVGSRVLVNAFMLPDGFEAMAVTVQLEVAERLAAKPDTSDYGLLGIWAQLDYDVSIVKRVSPRCFYPPPTVTSAIVRLKRTRRRRAGLVDPALFDALLKHAFSRRRKQIGTILGGFHHPRAVNAPAEALVAAGIEPARRPETVTVDEWIALAAALG